MTRRLPTLLLAVALSGTAAFAQFRIGAANTSGSTPTPPDPATMIASQVARLTTLLDLTTSQASQAATIFTNAQSAISTLQTTLSTYQTSLTAAVEGDNTSTIDTLAAEIGTAEGQIVDARAKANAAFYAILTATQQAKVQTLGLGILGGGPGGFGGPGPKGPH
ncbi:MAG TPA: Spy/CpxP family protein refolding chaperone [Bryobacteraceae bacterium]|nr:Spy/CpxP family protein refolding chaperone [Bryobacteraceae bacterium]